MTDGTPDRHALNVARAVQKEVAPAMVILFGSRATGRHREYSDIDLLVIAGDSSKRRAEIGARNAAYAYMKSNPPRLGLDVVGMTRKEFDYRRRAKQHIAGQAARYGVVMNGETLGPPPHYEDGYPAHWPETRQRIQNAEEYHHHFNEMVDENHWNQKTLGFLGQQAVENALKGWLSAYNDDRTFGHELTALWRDAEGIEDWSNPELGPLHESMTRLFDYIKYEDPVQTGEQTDWLTKYGVIYRYAGASYQMTQEERLQLRERINDAVNSVIKRVHAISGTAESDVYPEGIKPWDA